MRLEAVNELRNESARRDRLKDLPGPLASAWMRWACALDEDRDAPVLRAMRREFPKLEEFACAMEEAYWAPDADDGRDPAAATERSSRPPAAGFSKVVAMPVQPEPPLDNVRAEFDRAARTGDYNQALALCYNDSEPHASLHSLEDQAFAQMEEEQPSDEMQQALHVNLCAECGSTFSAEFSICPFDNAVLQPIGRSSAHSNLSASSTASLTARPFVLASARKQSQELDQAKAERIQSEIERLKVLLGEYGPKPEKAFQIFDTIVPLRKVVMGAGVVVIMVVMTALGYHYGKASAASLRTSINKTRAEIAGVVRDSDIQKELDQKLTLLKGSSIQATVERGIVTLAGITPSKWDSVHAESLALETSGVKLVNNLVEVEGTAPVTTAKVARGNRRN
jgi:osmotically-inducible protein OsmY